MIKNQGEGAGTSPSEGDATSSILAHYYTFAQIYFGRRLVLTDSGYKYAGDAIPSPTAYAFDASDAQAELQKQFSKTFTLMLKQLEACWTRGASMQVAVNTMKGMGTQSGGQLGCGVMLIRNGVRPQFTFQADATATASSG